MENPNTYDDEKFLSASNEVISSVGAMWEAGASTEDIEDAIQNGLENEGPSNVMVTIGVAG